MCEFLGKMYKNGAVVVAVVKERASTYRDVRTCPRTRTPARELAARMIGERCGRLGAAHAGLEPQLMDSLRPCRKSTTSMSNDRRALRPPRRRPRSYYKLGNFSYPEAKHVVSQHRLRIRSENTAHFYIIFTKNSHTCANSFEKCVKTAQ